MRYLLDTNILSALVRAPDGPLRDAIARVGEQNVYTSVIVASELRFGAAKKGSERLSRQVDAVLNAVTIASLSVPVDRTYAELRRKLEADGTPIGANDLLIASHAICDGSVLVTDNVGEFSRVPMLDIENWLRP
ncbi:type II toxin-antitoxin system VapC family toxin [Methylobacterium sp. J-090]|uniref:type II toxin-antitoxin system VapC family toxin n=1 Tax=Methylobacterium sp. J-090 TaxID=2836666 RepID=UPI001FB988EB|nr:type II toxin-antitoxin system VapC family toxin [Methylobacterium sp. J-090]MCJ2080808.1 type II toxin-antitoxin system VapC family toxin [Methylobacterium sp. J-090]